MIGGHRSIENRSEPCTDDMRPRSLREARECLGESVRGMAKRLGVSPTYLSMVENGKAKIAPARVSEFEDAYEIRFIRALTLEDWKNRAEFLQRVLNDLTRKSVHHDYDSFDGPGPSVEIGTVRYTPALAAYFDLCVWGDQDGDFPLPCTDPAPTDAVLAAAVAAKEASRG